MTQKRITILYLVTELDVGGAERTVYELARRTDRTRFRPIVAALSGGGEVGEWLAEAGVPVFDLKINSRIDVGGLFRLVQLLRAERVEILHSFLFHANIVGRAAAAVARVPMVISSVRVAEHARPWHVWLDGFTSWLVDAETVVSESVRRFTNVRGGVPMRKLVTICNGVDVSRFGMERSEARRQLGLPEDVPVVVFVGRFVWQKGADLIGHIVKCVRRQVRDATFLLAGDGPLRERVRRELKLCGLTDSVEFMGPRRDVPVILAAADVLMLPSRWEGLANVIMEAQAAGTVVVATDVEGSREAIEHGVTGMVTPAKNPKAMAEVIVDLLKRPEERKTIADRAEAAIRKGLTVERMTAANFALYAQLLKQHHTPSK